MGKVEIKIDDFVGFLPSGYISRQAVEVALIAPSNKMAYLEYSPSIPMDERVAICNSMHDFASRHILTLVKGGYVDDTVYKYGAAHYQKFRALHLTRSGLYSLTGTIDPETELDRIDACIKAGCSKRQATNYIRHSDHETECLNILNYFHNSKPFKSPSEEDTYNRFLHETIESGLATVLASHADRAKDTAISANGYTGHRLYKQWRLENIETLFRVNGFLTRLDKRPMDQYWLDKLRNGDEDFTDIKVNEVDDKRGLMEDEEEMIGLEQTPGTENRKLPLPIFVDQCLHEWYETHPGTYSFTQPYRKLYGDEVEQWNETPAFYPAYEIPGFGGKLQAKTPMIASGARNTLRYNFVGLAIGKVCNYLMYHTRPARTNWAESIERTSALAVQRAIDFSSEAEQVHGAGKSIENAIMVCTTVHQFASLFVVSKQKMPKRWQKIKRVGAPFNVVNIVTLNNSGAMLFRGLMLSTPIQFEEAIINSFVQRYPQFQKNNDDQYQLTYNGLPVLVAHSMDFQRLYYAWEDYLNGHKFLVSCYPEQVKFIQKIMPDVEFI